jgi:hypothetical protein
VVAAFALGALAGWLAVNAFGESPDDGPPSAAPSSAPAEPLAPGTATVTDACVEALSAAEDTVDVLDEIGSALADLDARRLDEVVQDLRPLRDRVRAGTAACDVEVAPPAPAGGSEAPDPGSQAPDPGSEAPDPGSEAPDPGSEAPDPGSGAPASPPAGQ